MSIREAVPIDVPEAISAPNYFAALAWGYNQEPQGLESAGCVLYFKVRINLRVRVLGELPFQQWSEKELALNYREKIEKLGIPKISYCVASPEIFADKPDSYPGVIGRYVADELARYSMFVIPADANVLNGWASVHALFRNDETGTPWLSIDPSCETLIKSIGMALSDDSKPDQLSQYSAALTALRFGAMSRPSPESVQESKPAPVGSPKWFMQREWESQRVESGGRKFGGTS